MCLIPMSNGYVRYIIFYKNVVTTLPISGRFKNITLYTKRGTIIIYSYSRCRLSKKKKTYATYTRY